MRLKQGDWAPWYPDTCKCDSNYVLIKHGKIFCISLDVEDDKLCAIRSLPGFSLKRYYAEFTSAVGEKQTLCKNLIRMYACVWMWMCVFVLIINIFCLLWFAAVQCDTRKMTLSCSFSHTQSLRSNSEWYCVRLTRWKLNFYEMRRNVVPAPCAHTLCRSHRIT